MFRERKSTKNDATSLPRGLSARRSKRSSQLDVDVLHGGKLSSNICSSADKTEIEFLTQSKFEHIDENSSFVISAANFCSWTLIDDSTSHFFSARLIELSIDRWVSGEKYWLSWHRRRERERNRPTSSTNEIFQDDVSTKQAIRSFSFVCRHV